MRWRVGRSLFVESCFVSRSLGYNSFTAINFHQSQKENGEVAELVMAPG
jgi:hypothetical protein